MSASSEVGAIPMSSPVDAKGNAHVTIPIDVAPGPRGMQPRLALEYASNDRGGNGSLGVGFALAGLGSVRRCGKTLDVDGVWKGVEFDDDDALCLNGNRLVLATGSYGQDGSEYRTLQDTFARVVLHGTIAEVGSWFEVFHKDGTISSYGNGNSTLYRVSPSGQDLYQPYEWGLREQRDRFDNTILYDYDPNLQTDPTFAELRPSVIAYGGTERAKLVEVRCVVIEPKSLD